MEVSSLQTLDDIVLLDTKSTYGHLICVSKPFDENVPDYYAISYRWGEHPQWRAQTPNYVTYVTSISRYNLIKLCHLYRDIIPYLWIDTICINQTDAVQRKKAIKNMDNIYRCAKKIVAVPDLCYCHQNPRMDMVTKEDIETAVELISRSEVECNRAEPTPHDVQLRECLSSLPATMFICDIIKEWACRCWVISERTIGVNDNKLELIILRGNGIMIPYLLWDTYLKIEWDIEFNQHTLIKAIINSKSTKYIDRLFAILPHTKYKGDLQRLVDEDRVINHMIELKMALFDILDMEGKILLLEDQLPFGRRLPYQLPSFIKDEQTWIVRSSLFKTVHANIDTIMYDGKHALKVSGPYTTPSLPEVPPRSIALLGGEVESVIDILLATGVDDEPNAILRCVGSNGVWVAESTHDVRDDTCADYKHYGEFIVI
ncbi:hypothetical protein EC973_002955 [Apophysomyces ossiformis]|uniref:Heterokaryon incompatibility domain-containing protein n=1 Tax=Apophysomyces ossiformis TaxID=679940 RepID=A0A8H7BRT3_9FUNG|nr:hypothetical protein EC973_002955 [Apophysomyces ossiformis]